MTNASGRAAYSMAQHGRADSAAEMRNFVCTSGAVATWMLKYGGGLNVLRILPQYVPGEAATPTTPATAGYWLPSKTGVDPMAVTDWIRSYAAVKGFGEPGSTFLLRDQTDPYAPEIGQTPPYIVYDEVKRAVDAGQDRSGWARLLTGGKGTFAVIPRTTTLYLVRAAIVSRGDDKQPFNPPRGLGDGDAPVVLVLSKSAGESLLSAVSEAQVQGVADPLDVNAGMFGCFYKLGTPLPPVAGRVMGKVHGGDDPKGYGALLDRQFAYPGQQPISAALPPVFLERAVSRYKPWDEFVRFPTVSEQAAWLCETLPPDVIMYAFRNHPDWISDTVRQQAAAAVSVQVPYGMQPPQYGAQPQQYGAQPQQYGAPPQQYGVLPPQYGVPPPQYGVPPQQYGAPPQYPTQPGYSPPQSAGMPEYVPPPQYVPPQQPPAAIDVPFTVQQPVQQPVQYPAHPPAQFPGQPLVQYPAQPTAPTAPTAAGFAAMAAGPAIGGVGAGVAGQPSGGWAQPVGIQPPTWAAQPNPVANPAGVGAQPPAWLAVAGPQTSRSAAAANIAAQFGG